MFKVNQMVNWTTQDEEGTFSYTGRIVSINSKRVEINTEVGVIGFDLSDGKLRKSKSKGTDIVSITNVPAKKQSKHPATLKPGTTKYAVFQLLNGKDVTRKEAIQMIVAAGLSTPAGASTHFNSVRKML